MEENIDKIRDIMTEAVDLLFRSFGFTTLKKIETVQSDISGYLQSRERFGFIVTMGPFMNGAWSVAADAELLRITHKKAVNKDLTDENDWLAELTNLVIGTIKGILVKYHMDFEVSAVLTVDRARLIDSFLPVGSMCHQRFEQNGAYMDLFYGVYFAYDVKLSAIVPDEQAAICDLGAGIVF